MRSEESGETDAVLPLFEKWEGSSILCIPSRKDGDEEVVLNGTTQTRISS